MRRDASRMEIRSHYLKVVAMRRKKHDARMTLSMLEFHRTILRWSMKDLWLDIGGCRFINRNQLVKLV